MPARLVHQHNAVRPGAMACPSSARKRFIAAVSSRVITKATPVSRAGHTAPIIQAEGPHTFGMFHRIPWPHNLYIDGVSILGPETVKYMTSEQIGTVRGPLYLPGPGYGFGLGFAVRLSVGQ